MDTQSRMHEMILSCYVRCQEILVKCGFHEMVAVVLMPEGEVCPVPMTPMLKIAEKAWADGDKDSYHHLKRRMWNSLRDGLKMFHAEGVIIVSEVWVGKGTASKKEIKAARECEDRREAIIVRWEYKIPGGTASGSRLRYFRRENGKPVLEEELADAEEMLGESLNLLPE